ncbi:MAG: hypothetical protein PUD59_00550 [bacterium]|nr:hypothetical protein [bacterium]
MIIQLQELFSNIKEEILINNNVIFSNELIKKSDINSLENVKVNGKIYKDSYEELILDVTVKGDMHVNDSISLDDIIYKFNIKIEENIEEILEKNQNSIDILPILWQNIVLEAPLRYTKVKDLSKYSGDGWKLLSEDEIKSNNPFYELMEKFKEE